MSGRCETAHVGVKKKLVLCPRNSEEAETAHQFLRKGTLVGHAALVFP